MLPSILLQFELALIGFVLSLLTFVVQIALVIWTYSDATDNSSYSAILWAIVVLFAPLIGWCSTCCSAAINAKRPTWLTDTAQGTYQIPRS